MSHHSANSAPVLTTASSDSYEAFLSHLGQKALASVTRHTELCEADAALGYGRCWKRLAGTLGRLAPHATEAVGSQVVRLYIPDGKYRKQVFTLEDDRTGSIRVYLPDILDAAIAEKLIRATAPGSGAYTVEGQPNARIQLDLIDANTNDIPPFCKPMLGWGRRALRTTVTAVATDAEIALVERLCELAAVAWEGQATAAVPAQ
jgi:hypothetical protein